MTTIELSEKCNLLIDDQLDGTALPGRHHGNVRRAQNIHAVMFGVDVGPGSGRELAGRTTTGKQVGVAVVFNNSSVTAV